MSSIHSGLEPGRYLFRYPGGQVEIPPALAGGEHRDRVLLTGAYCPRGHGLIRPENETFDGLPGIALGATDGRISGTLTLSPLQGDPRKLGPEFPVGARLRLSCPTCGVELTVLGPCDCHPEGEYVALYTVQTPDPDYCVGICRRWGCFQSFLRDAGRVLVEVKAHR